MKHGDFSALADNYSKFRPDYSQTILRAILGIINLPTHQIDFVDIGAGTGIWTRMVSQAGVRSATAVEPNKYMRQMGISNEKNNRIAWVDASAERTGLEDNSADWISMASSFHWVDFESAVEEFSRVLRNGGWFTALWNPRLLEVSPLLLEIENHLSELRPNIKRISSGKSGITENLTEKLLSTNVFKDVIYSEARHTINMTKERYIGAWNSVNDLRVQLGDELFAKFLQYLHERLEDVDEINATYLTRSWTARLIK